MKRSTGNLRSAQQQALTYYTIGGQKWYRILIKPWKFKLSVPRLWEVAQLWEGLKRERARHWSHSVWWKEEWVEREGTESWRRSQILVGQVKHVLISLRAMEHFWRVLSRGKHAQICIKVFPALAWWMDLEGEDKSQGGWWETVVA